MDNCDFVEITHGLRCWRVSRGERLLIGRSETADIRVDDDRVSRHHAEVRFVEAPILRDLGSANGTFLDGVQIAQWRVERGLHTLSLGDERSSDALVITLRADQASSDGDPGPMTDPAPHAMPAPSQALTIGRAPGNDYVVDDLLVSRNHARLIPTADGYLVEDLGSSNGTYVNGKRITRARLGPRDLLSIGNLQITTSGGQLHGRTTGDGTGLSVRGLSVESGEGVRLLDDVSFELSRNALLAVIGTSGAGKSTMLGALTGARVITAGSVLFDGRELRSNYEELRHHIGVVPQDDILHRELTVRQALAYSAELRFPTDVERTIRSNRIDEVLNQLRLTKVAHVPLEKVSGGQRKRASVAIEMLTRPSSLFLDEPTSGLDAGLTKGLMQNLRSLADKGQTVVVVTHDTDQLALCDRVLFLVPGGRVGFFGEPSNLLAFFGAAEYADAMILASEDPDRWHNAYLESLLSEGSPSPAFVAEPDPQPAPAAPARQSMAHQVGTLTRRHARIIVSNRVYLATLVILPIVLGLLTLIVPGESGFRKPPTPTGEATQLLVIMIFGAAFMGMSTSFRELVAERAIFGRERAVGLMPLAYITSKLAVFGLIVTAQCTVMVTLVLLIRQAPDQALTSAAPAIELGIACVATAMAGVVLGLLISSVASSSETATSLMVVSAMAQLVLCGGLIDVTGRIVIDQLSWLIPSRWGFAAAAASSDLMHADLTTTYDPLWTHSLPVWLFDLTVIGILAVAVLIWVRFRLEKVSSR